jgi:hypothetical protein
VQSQHTQFKQLIDQAGNALTELVFVTDKRKYHTDRKFLIKYRQRCHPDNQDTLCTEDQAIRSLVTDAAILAMRKSALN